MTVTNINQLASRIIDKNLNTMGVVLFVFVSQGLESSLIRGG